MKTKNKILTLISYFFLFNNIFAAGGELDSDLMKVAKAMLILTIILIALTSWLAFVYSEKNDSAGDTFLLPLKNILKFLTKSTPIEKEQEILLNHDYDGIRELDNRIPPWFHALFWGTIVFAVVYLIKFHVIGSGNVMEQEYNEEIQAALLQKQILVKTGALLNEETVVLLTDAASLDEGKGIYQKNCVACHGQNGEGLVGPNLTDDYWIHGGGIKNVFITIKNGVPSKGMISWQTQLTPNQMQAVGSYVISLHGTNPANAKAPEGTIYVEQSDSLKKANS